MITFFLSIPNDLAALDQISWGFAITTNIGSVEIGMGIIFYLDPEVMLSSRSKDNLSRTFEIKYWGKLRLFSIFLDLWGLKIISLKVKENRGQTRLSPTFKLKSRKIEMYLIFPDFSSKMGSVKISFFNRNGLCSSIAITFRDWWSCWNPDPNFYLDRGGTPRSISLMLP